MILNEEQLRSVTLGAVRVCADADGVFRFYRFTEGQMEFYGRYNRDFHLKAQAGAGIRFDFYTDSSRFAFTYDSFKASSRDFCFFDVYVDGILCAHPGEMSMTVCHGTVEQALPAGEHRVTVWFPNLAGVTVTRAELDDGASLRPAPVSIRMLCWGDSITQGYDAVFPSLSYPNALARHFEADAVNQGIGAERFVPGLLDAAPDLHPDIITIAYGTNDWTGRKPADFCAGVNGFLEGVAARYPDAATFVITPIWRADSTKSAPFGDFSEACRYIADKAAECGFHVVNGVELTPHWSEFYSDRYLHPNDLGFTEYAKNLISRMEAELPALRKGRKTGNGKEKATE